MEIHHAVVILFTQCTVRLELDNYRLGGDIINLVIRKIGRNLFTICKKRCAIAVYTTKRDYFFGSKQLIRSMTNNNERAAMKLQVL